MKVSILVPIYNVEKYIHHCLDSINNQTYSDIEVILVDDCSPDGSMDIVHQYLSKSPELKSNTIIKYHALNKGLAQSRQDAINMATGDYVYHLDSDDYIDPECIYTFVDIAKRTGADIILGNHRSVYINGISKYITREVNNDKESLIFNIIARKQPCNIWNNLIRKELYDGLEIPNINNGEDYVMLPRLLYKAKVISYNHNVTYNYTHYNPNAFQFNTYNYRNLCDLQKGEAFLKNYFSDKERVYSDALEIAHAINITTIIVGSNDIAELVKINNDVPINAIRSYLPSHYLIILFLHKLGLYKIVLMICKIFRKTKTCP